MRTTIKQIADETGLSLPSISLALNGRGRMSVETRRRVAAAARKLGYRPNASARAMQSGRFNAIALVLSKTVNRSSLVDGYLSGILKALETHEQHLVIADFPEERFIEVEAAPKMLRESTADGMIINYIQQIPAQFEEHLRRAGVPCVWTNVQRPVDSVYFDDRGGSQALTRHLLGLGHSRVEFVDYVHTLDPVLDHYSTFDRYDGYAAAMEEAGLRPARITLGRLLSTEEMLADAKRSLSAPFRPTAVVAYGREAFAFYRAACELGIRVPQELTICSFASAAQLALGLPIALAVLPGSEMGQIAADMLVGKLSDNTPHADSITLPLHFELKYCGPPA